VFRRASSPVRPTALEGFTINAKPFVLSVHSAAGLCDSGSVDDRGERNNVVSTTR
jgi:hypothetical protein